MSTLAFELRPAAALPGVAVAVLHGAVDPRSVGLLASELSGAAGRGYRTLVLDLGDVRYINSAGLAYLITLSDDLAGKGGRLLLAGPQPKVKVVFDLMGVTRFFRRFRSVSAALAALAAARRKPPVRERAGAAGRRS